MITEEERVIRKSQGYDIGFAYEEKKYWVNSNTWNEEKAKRLYQETGLLSFKEERGNKKLVLYDPEYFEVWYAWRCPRLVIKDLEIIKVPQPINMSSAYFMFGQASALEYLDLSNWNFSDIVDMNNMFSECEFLSEISLGVCQGMRERDMQHMFEGDSLLQNIQLKDWSLSELMLLKQTFSGCDMLHTKYAATDDRELLDKIIKDTDNSLKELQAF